MNTIYIFVAAIIIFSIFIIIFTIKKKSKNNNKVSLTSEMRSFSLSSIFSSSEINEEFFASLENTLISSDVGVKATKEIIRQLRGEIDNKSIKVREEAKSVLKDILLASFSDNTFDIEGKTILFVVGVNGVGKTTTIAKLANLIKKDKTVILAAADTFRAAAIEQLESWANKISIPIVKGQQAGDPSSVLFSALEKAEKENIDVVIVDTAGRFHNQENLIRQLEKMKKISLEKFTGFKFIPILILDGNVGHNGLIQAKVFLESLNIHGIILSKLDGSCKGGVAIAVSHELSIPILYSGYGEKVGDIKVFDKNEFVNSIL